MVKRGINNFYQILTFGKNYKTDSAFFQRTNDFLSYRNAGTRSLRLKSNKVEIDQRRKCSVDFLTARTQLSKKQPQIGTRRV
jgi:hypothetical protein